VFADRRNVDGIDKSAAVLHPQPVADHAFARALHVHGTRRSLWNNASFATI
jgi:hypothetical protein